ncbi:hypothetical protein GUJ75_24260|nr:hypothetical protein [Escherichia coli]
MEEGKVNPGAFVKVTINTGSDAKAILVPANAIIQDDRKKQLIQVKGGNANFVTVQTGVTQADYVEVLNGLQPGDTVVVTGVLFARPKSPLKVRSVKTLELLKN